MNSFGERLRKLRNGKKLTQKELSILFKISESAVGMYERNEREPSFELVKTLAEYFEVTTDYLLGHQAVQMIGRVNRLPSNDIDRELEEALNDPDFEIFYKELKGSPEENRQKALDFLRYLNEQEKK